MKYHNKLIKRKEELSISFNQISAITGVNLYRVKRIFAGFDVENRQKVLDLIGFDSTLKPIKKTEEVIKSQIEKRANKLLSRVVHSCALEEQTPTDPTALKIRQNIIKQLKSLPRGKIWQ